MAENSDNSGMGVIAGVLIAVVLMVGGYMFLANQGTVDAPPQTNIEMPDDVDINLPEPAAGDEQQ